jgi:6,7-dimethyl-8-ribityllumazine synthase
MQYEGDFSPPTGRFVIVAARFNSFVVDRLIVGAQDAFAKLQVPAEQVDVVRVPGSFEIPVVAQHLAQSGKYAAVICLGCVIRGDTDHYEHVASAATNGIMSAGINSGVPVIFGVLTTETLDQAIHRAGAKAGNKGFEAGMTAVEMVNLLAQLSRE